MLKTSLSGSSNPGAKSAKQLLPQLSKKPRVVNVLPIQINGKRTLTIYQVTVEYKYVVHFSSHTEEMTENVVFELNSSVSDPRWRVCGKVGPSNKYFV